MIFYWICDIIPKKQFNLYWKKGDLQKGCHYSKNHPPNHQRKVRPTYLHVPQRKHISNLQGCVHSDLGALYVHAIKIGVQGVHRQITQYIRCVYSRYKIQTAGITLFNKYSPYNNNNGDLCKIPKKNDFNNNSLSLEGRFIKDSNSY